MRMHAIGIGKCLIYRMYDQMLCRMRMHALRMHAFGIGIGISNPRSSIPFIDTSLCHVQAFNPAYTLLH